MEWSFWLTRALTYVRATDTRPVFGVLYWHETDSLGSHFPALGLRMRGWAEREKFGMSDYIGYGPSWNY